MKKVHVQFNIEIHDKLSHGKFKSVLKSAIATVSIGEADMIGKLTSIQVDTIEKKAPAKKKAKKPAKAVGKSKK